MKIYKILLTFFGLLLQGWTKFHNFKKQSLMPISAIILIALKWRQTSEHGFLNREYVSERWDANTKLR